MADAKNKTIPTAADVLEFVARLEDTQQRRDSEALIELMQRVSNQPPVLWGPAIIGFGSYHYAYESGREGDMPRIAFSPRKGKLTLYLIDDPAQYTDLLGRLGKHKTSKACLYITRLSDVDMTTLEELMRAAYQDSLKKFPDESKGA